MPTPRKNPELLRRCELALLLDQTKYDRQLAEEFGVTVRTVWSYFKSVRDRWALEEAGLRPQRRAQFRALCMQNIADARAMGKPEAVANTLRILAKLDGLEAPAKIEVTGHVDIRTLSPHERQAEIDRLIRKRAMARGAIDANGADGDEVH